MERFACFAPQAGGAAYGTPPGYSVVTLTRVGSSSCADLEPKVRNTSTVPRQVFEGVQAFKAVDRYLRYNLWLSETEIDSNTAASVFVRPLTTPVGYATANGTEVKFNRVASGVSLMGLARRLGFISR